MLTRFKVWVKKWVGVKCQTLTTCLAPQIGDKPDLDKCEQGGRPGPQPTRVQRRLCAYLKPFQCSGPNFTNGGGGD